MEKLGTKDICVNVFAKNNLIVNADDFGKNKLINDAIVFCLNHNLINSASLMVGEPGFVEAVSFIKESEIKNVGLHVNLTEGKPLSNFGFDYFLLENGEWDPKKSWSPKILQKDISLKFEKEITLQLEKMTDTVFIPTHINSHHHIHTTPFLFSIFLKIAQKFKIKLRLCQSNLVDSYPKYYYRMFINKLIKSKGLAFSDSFESVDSWNSRKHILGFKKTEIMVHPIFLPDYSKIIDNFDKVDFIKQISLI